MATAMIWAGVAPSSVQNGFGAFTCSQRFTTSAAGYILGVSFYRTAGETGAHNGYLWDDATNALLASCVFADSTAVGWEYQAFTTPVAVTAGHVYAVGYDAAGVGNIPYDAAVRTPQSPLSIPSADGGHTRYANGTAQAYPQGNTGGSVWGVDVTYNDTNPGGGSGGGTTSTAVNQVVLGAVGGSPITGTYVLDGNGSGAVDETATARIIEASITTNLADVYGSTAFIGGASNAGLPANATITGVGLINPIGTGGRTDYTTCLPVISYHVNDKTGGVSIFNNDGRFRDILTSAGPVYSLNVDNAHATMYIGTSDGVLSRSTDVRAVHVWAAVGALHGKVIRIAVETDGSGNAVLFVHVEPKDKNLYGIYRFPGLSGSLTGAGYDGWTPVHLDAHVQDFVATDAGTIWLLLGNDQGTVHRYHIGDADPITSYALPTGIRAFALSRVITTGDGSHPAQDSVWAMTQGDNNGCYFTVKAADGTWSNGLIGGNQDGSLQAPSGQGLSCNGATGLGITIGGKTVAGAYVQGQYTSVFLCSNAGIWWSATLDGKGWTRATDLGGLSDDNIVGVVAGQYQALQGALTTRFFAWTPKQFFYSNSDARWWRDLTKEELHLGPYFALLAQKATNDLPDNGIITIGPTVHSPIGNPDATHISLPGCLPATQYWERRLDDCLDWRYRLWESASISEACMPSGLANLQTSEHLTLDRSSADLATVSRRWLAENSVPQRQLTVKCPITSQESGLWDVMPTMLVHVNLTDTIAQLSPVDGSVVGTQVVNLVNSPWWVLDVELNTDQPGGSLAYATLTLGSVLAKQAHSPDDIAAGLADSIRIIRNFGGRGG